MPPSVQPATAPLLEIHQLCFGYPGRTLFNALTLQIGAGLTLVRGDDGSGKTSFLRLLAGHLQPQSGTLVLDATPLHGAHASVASPVFYVEPGDSALDPLSVSELRTCMQSRYPHQFDTGLWTALLQALGLAPHQDKQLYMLSTGSRRKLLLAAAAASGARLTLLEQPFAALDQRSVQVVLQLLADAATQTHRAWVLADYVGPPGVPLASVIDLDLLNPR
jgi:ABC-type multidrug transport system ATPase subunit